MTTPAHTSPARPGVRRPRWIAFFLLPALIAVAGYGYTLGDFFLSDDFMSLYHGATAEGWRESTTLGGTWTAQWFRPLTLASWWLQFPLFGLEPFGYRLTNLLVHVIDAGLLAWLVATLAGSDRAGAVAGAVFAAQPNHAEAVTWISARFDPLCALGILVCLLAWTRHATTSRGVWPLVLAVLGLLWAVASKEPGLGVLVLIPIVTLGYLGRPSRRAWVGYLVLLCVGAALFLLRWQIVGGMGGPNAWSGRSPAWRLAPGHVARFTWDAVSACVAPIHAGRFPEPWHPLLVIPLGAILLGLFARLRAGGAGRLLQLAWPLAICFGIMLLPMVTWVHLPSDNQSTRLLYIPSLFSCALLGLFLAPAAKLARSGLAAWLPATVLAAAWTVGLAVENQTWHAAAASARQILDAFPPPEEIRGGPIQVVGLPDNDRGAYVYRNSFAFAVKVFTPERRRVIQIRRKNQGALGQAGPRTVTLRWNPRAERWVELR
jgi:hypothetical protein